jgi:hypothetical protein
MNCLFCNYYLGESSNKFVTYGLNCNNCHVWFVMLSKDNSICSMSFNVILNNRNYTIISYSHNKTVVMGTSKDGRSYNRLLCVPIHMDINPSNAKQKLKFILTYM